MKIRVASFAAAWALLIFGSQADVRAGSRALKLKSTSCGHRVTVGVDYYPEQWAPDDMPEDMKAIKNDLGADFIRIGEFMWQMLEPQDGLFNFTFLDKVLDAAESFGLEVMLGTPTATVPAWLYSAYPEIFARGPDAAEGYVGSTSVFGGRNQRSFHSQVYHKYSKRIVTAMAERYGNRKVITIWQIDNELGNEQSDVDFSDVALAAWRSWLTEKFNGDIHKLNAAWGTVFWSVTYDSFAQIPLPRFTRPGGALQGEEAFRSNQSPGMLLDYRRFSAESVTSFANMQVEILREKKVLGCVTSNTPGGYWGRAMNHNDIFASMDFPAFDNYPVWGGSLVPDSPANVAMMLDTVRGWTSQNDRTAGWMVAEQLIGAQGHDIIGYTPRPHQIVAWSTQALLHGATSLAFFRYRAATRGQEMFCYGILDHTTERGTGRKWHEAKELYQLARQHKSIWLGPVDASVALLYSMDSIFSWNAQPQSTAFDYAKEALRMYQPFWMNGAAVDVVSLERFVDEFKTRGVYKLLKKYGVLLLPAPLIIPDELVSMLKDFAELGGTIWIGYRSDLKDHDNAMRRQTSRLAALAGVQIEEIESLNTPLTTTVNSPKFNKSARASVWRDGLRILEDSGAQAVWKYTDKFFGALGYAAVTERNTTKHGSVVYMGTGLPSDDLVPLAVEALQRQRVPHVGLPDLSNALAASNVEQMLRKDVDGKFWRVAINHGEDSLAASDGTDLKPYAIDIRLVESLNYPAESSHHRKLSAPTDLELLIQ